MKIEKDKVYKLEIGSGFYTVLTINAADKKDQVWNCLKLSITNPLYFEGGMSAQYDACWFTECLGTKEENAEYFV